MSKFRNIILGHVFVIAALSLMTACGGGNSGGGNGNSGSNDATDQGTVKSVYAYIINSGTSDVSAYRINTSTGEPGKINCGNGTGCNGENFAITDEPYDIEINSTGQYAYIVNISGVSLYAIDSKTGKLTLKACGTGASCSPDSVNYITGSDPRSITFDKTGKFAYVANYTSNDISAYTVNSISGALSRINCGGGINCNGENFKHSGTNRLGPVQASIHQSGKFLYVTNYLSGTVVKFNVNTSTGLISPTNCLANGGTYCVAGVLPTNTTINPMGSYLYTAYMQGNVAAYSISQSTGLLTKIDCGGGIDCYMNGSNFISALGPVVNSITVSPNGEFAYAVKGNTTHTLSIDSSTGMITPVGTITGGSFPGHFEIEQAGKYAYRVNWLSDDMIAYKIDTITGELKQIECSGDDCSGTRYDIGYNTKPVSVAITNEI